MHDETLASVWVSWRVGKAQPKLKLQIVHIEEAAGWNADKFKYRQETFFLSVNALLLNHGANLSQMIILSVLIANRHKYNLNNLNY